MCVFTMCYSGRVKALFTALGVLGSSVYVWKSRKGEGSHSSGSERHKVIKAYFIDISSSMPSVGLVHLYRV